MRKHDVTVYGCKFAVSDPPIKSKPELDPLLLTAVHPDPCHDSFVYLHCHFYNEWPNALIRIWRTSYLVDPASGARSPLVHAENISIAPVWTLVRHRSTFRFLLIFAGLPKACRRFDLIEEIPQPGGFSIKDIQRNQQDVYHVEV